MKPTENLKLFFKHGSQLVEFSKPPELAAALAYHGIMSLPALLMIIFILSRYFLIGDHLEQQITTQATNLFGSEASSLLDDTVYAMFPENFGKSWFITIFGIGYILLTASGLFLELQLALNRVWGAPPSKHASPITFIQRRFIAIMMLAIIGIIYIIPIRLEQLTRHFVPSIPTYIPTQSISNTTLFLLLAIALAFVYKKAPNVTISWKDVWLSAIVSTGFVFLGWNIAGKLISLQTLESVFDVFSLFALLLISVNCLALIIVCGAVFCRVYAMVFGSLKGQKPERGFY